MIINKVNFSINHQTIITYGRLRISFCKLFGTLLFKKVFVFISSPYWQLYICGNFFLNFTKLLSYFFLGNQLFLINYVFSMSQSRKFSFILRYKKFFFSFLLSIWFIISHAVLFVSCLYFIWKTKH